MVIRHPFNLGIGGAMQSGYKYALRHGYDVAVQVDGDGQHKPEYLPELLAALQTEGDEADMVTGSRFLGEPGYKVPLGRRAGNLIFAVVMSTITRRKVTDPTSGFRMTNRRGIELFARDYPHDYPEVEAILMLHAHRLRLHEVHVSMNAARTTGGARSTTRAAPTTWSRCSWRSSSASSAAAPPPSRSRARTRSSAARRWTPASSRRITGGDK